MIGTPYEWSRYKTKENRGKSDYIKKCKMCGEQLYNVNRSDGDSAEIYICPVCQYKTIETLQQENEQLKDAIKIYSESAKTWETGYNRLQQENGRLKDENASIRNWNACEEKLHNELLESDKRRIELEEEVERLNGKNQQYISEIQSLCAEKTEQEDYRVGLEAIIDKFQAQAARMREALQQVQHDLDVAECRDDLDGIKGYIDEAIADYFTRRSHCPKNEKKIYL